MATKTKTKPKRKRAAAQKVRTITRYRAPKRSTVRRRQRSKKSSLLSGVPGKAAIAAATGAALSYPLIFNQVEKLPNIPGVPKTLLAGLLGYYLNAATIKNPVVKAASESAIIAGAFQAGTNFKKPAPMTIQGDEYSVSGDLSGDDAHFYDDDPEFLDVSGSDDEISDEEYYEGEE